MRFVRVIVRGRVQGVGFRWFARSMAQEHDVSGWVRNRPDGSVEAELCGTADAVDAVLAALRRGPAGAHVRTVESEDATGTPSAGFEIRPTD
ncbi:acylphosphatase [Microbacterium bovistercoris]|uniref:Acylphosphatase n=1 Tax=Microbacterium bovistercoris TaxID=2293570 RepID=A0A371NSM3_9MICO|nr:acylphosphatase [Microbacterium bovistercoris]REJ04747.1 acylphosphatase [Microbacterium bovistercoris]